MERSQNSHSSIFPALKKTGKNPRNSHYLAEQTKLKWEQFKNVILSDAESRREPEDVNLKKKKKQHPKQKKQRKQHSKTPNSFPKIEEDSFQHVHKLFTVVRDWAFFITRKWQPGWRRRSPPWSSTLSTGTLPPLHIPAPKANCPRSWVCKRGTGPQGWALLPHCYLQAVNILVILQTQNSHSIIIKSKPLSVLHRPFLVFPPDLSVSKGDSHHTKSMETFLLDLASWIVMLGLEIHSLGSVLQGYPLPTRAPIRGVGRRRKHVKQNNSWRSKPSDKGLGLHSLISERLALGWGRRLQDGENWHTAGWRTQKVLDEAVICPGPGGLRGILKQKVPGNKNSSTYS